jgi:hypothetical protein
MGRDGHCTLVELQRGLLVKRDFLKLRFNRWSFVHAPEPGEREQPKCRAFERTVWLTYVGYGTGWTGRASRTIGAHVSALELVRHTVGGKPI